MVHHSFCSKAGVLKWWQNILQAKKSGTRKNEVARHPQDATYFMESLLYLSF